MGRIELIQKRSKEIKRIGVRVPALDMGHLLHVLDGLESEHRGYKMKNAELFGNGQSKSEVLEETWVEQFNVHGSGLKSANRLISIRMMPQ